MKTARQLRTGLVGEGMHWSDELARLKAERDELRECLKWVMEDIAAMHPDMLRAYVAERARAVLERTEGK